MSEKRNKIVLNEGYEEEKTIYLKRPKGRKAREMMPKVLSFMSELSLEADEDGNADVETVSVLIGRFWSKEEFEDTLLPFVLQMEDEEGRKYLEEECTVVDILDAFSKAASYLIEESFQRKEVEEALGKSEEEVQETHSRKK